MNPTSARNSISYVPQENLLLGDLTAREMFRHSAKFKLNTTDEKIEERVDTVLKDLGIDHVADTYIGTIFRAGLSGGQQRRVAAGIELIATPSVLLLGQFSAIFFCTWLKINA